MWMWIKQKPSLIMSGLNRVPFTVTDDYFHWEILSIDYYLKHILAGFFIKYGWQPHQPLGKRPSWSSSDLLVKHWRGWKSGRKRSASSLQLFHSIIELLPHRSCFLHHFIVKLMEVFPIGREKRILPKQIPQSDWHSAAWFVVSHFYFVTQYFCLLFFFACSTRSLCVY